MGDWHFWVPTGISLAAAAFSAASWWHNLSAHGERRFGEITKLRSSVLQRLTRVEERLGEADQGLRSTRFDLRRLPESHPNKYDWIEEAPALAEEADDSTEKAQRLRWSIERLSTDENSSRILRALQLAEHEIGVLEHSADKLTRVAEEQIKVLNQIKTREDAEREARFEELTRLVDEAKSLEPPET